MTRRVVAKSSLLADESAVASVFNTRFGEPEQILDDGSVKASFWVVDERILLLHASGRAQYEVALEATRIQSEQCRRFYSQHGRRMYVAWSFGELEHYGPRVGALYVRWLHEHRDQLLRTVLYTENKIARMTGMATNLTFNNTATFPTSFEDLMETLEDWLIRIHRPR